ncbi:BtpA/SgcQ family protein [Rubrobacter aplysinae]|uniref:BtpA/SgcQ family protein n=1 Tax=Rubrobacter aplysinae TaxID=909625 RepID=UPI00064BE0CE|nr:BtpA/SgcQ family protein [Rubrobacter aplysinae]
MSVFPQKEDALHGLFGTDGAKKIIGVIHSKALPGAPGYRGESLDDIYRFAVEEGLRYRDGGVQGLVVENHWDLPFAKPGDIGLETAAAMSAMSLRVREEVALPVGINVLANGTECALAVAKAAGATFVRANQWVNAYVANEGFIEGAAPQATRYRSMLRAEDDIKFFTDVHVKHGSHAIVADRTLEEQVRDAEFFDSDVLIATGERTGGAAELGELSAIKEAASLPVIVGSGISLENVSEIMEIADGAIVASSLKETGKWWSPVSVERVKRLMDRVGSL